MLNIYDGSCAYKLIELLAAVGEFPQHSLSIIGSERTLTTLVCKLGKKQQFRLNSGGAVHTGKLLQMSGKGSRRTIRLYKGALTVLNEVHPDALGNYLEVTGNHTFHGDTIHVDRNHRVAETAAMCQAANIAFLPYSLPKLQREKIMRVIPDSPCFYLARDLKKTDRLELNKTIYTRIVGGLFYSGGCYAVYNARSSVMKWQGGGEIKAQIFLTELARMNAEVSEVDSAILFTRNYQVAIDTLMKSEDVKRGSGLGFHRLYKHVHFVPLEKSGARLLKILTSPDWNERMLDALFERSARPLSIGSIDYDALLDGEYFFSHLDGDLARLIRLRDALRYSSMPFTVLGYPWQREFLLEFFGETVRLRNVEMEAIEGTLKGG